METPIVLYDAKKILFTKIQKQGSIYLRNLIIESDHGNFQIEIDAQCSIGEKALTPIIEG